MSSRTSETPLQSADNDNRPRRLYNNDKPLKPTYNPYQVVRFPPPTPVPDPPRQTIRDGTQVYYVVVKSYTALHRLLHDASIGAACFRECVSFGTQAIIISITLLLPDVGILLYRDTGSCV